jgi:hypothetical protein
MKTPICNELKRYERVEDVLRDIEMESDDVRQHANPERCIYCGKFHVVMHIEIKDGELKQTIQ